MGVAGSIFEPHPSNFGNQPIFWSCTRDSTIPLSKSLLVSDIKKFETSYLSIYRDLHGSSHVPLGFAHRPGWNMVLTELGQATSL